MTEKEAYTAMIYYLEDYYSRLKYDDLKILLSELAVGEDGIPLDSAVWDEWKVAVKKALEDDRLRD